MDGHSAERSLHPKFNINGQQKVSISLSSYAMDVLRMDHGSFPGEKYFAGFLNTVIENYQADASASITACLERYAEECRQTIREYLPEEGSISQKDMDVVIEALCHGKAKELQRQALSYPKEEPLVFRLSDRLARLLYGEYGVRQPWPDQRYYDPANPDTADPYAYKIGRFLKAVLEEYARKPPIERERIILKERLAVIDGAVRNRRKLRIVLPEAGQMPRVFIMRPYRTLVDGNHLYLVGMSRERGKGGPKDGPEILVSMRISRMADIDAVATGSGRITAAEEADIKKGCATAAQPSSSVTTTRSSSGSPRRASACTGIMSTSGPR